MKKRRRRLTNRVLAFVMAFSLIAVTFYSDYAVAFADELPTGSEQTVQDADEEVGTGNVQEEEPAEEDEYKEQPEAGGQDDEDPEADEQEVEQPALDQEKENLSDDQEEPQDENKLPADEQDEVNEENEEPADEEEVEP